MRYRTSPSTLWARDGAADPRHESGDVTIHVWHIAGRLCQESIPHRPLMPPAAGGAKNAEILLPDAQERADLALDAAVDLASRGWAYEDEVFITASIGGTDHTIVSLE